MLCLRLSVFCVMLPCAIFFETELPYKSVAIIILLEYDSATTNYKFLFTSVLFLIN